PARMEARYDAQELCLKPLVVDRAVEEQHKGGSELTGELGEGDGICSEKVLDRPNSLAKLGAQAQAPCVVPPTGLRDIAAGRKAVDDLHPTLLRLVEALLEFVPGQAFGVGICHATIELCLVPIRNRH